MSFICPTCKQAKLNIAKSIELGSDDCNDELSFQMVHCSNCKFKGIAIYEESRRGCKENVHHYGYQVAEEIYNKAYSDIENNSIKNYNYYVNKDNNEMFWMEYKK